MVGYELKNKEMPKIVLNKQGTKGLFPLSRRSIPYFNCTTACYINRI